MANSFVIEGIEIIWLGHASFLLEGGKRIYIDPFILSEHPEKADYILFSHDHYDHCDANKIETIRKSDTVVAGAAGCAKTVANMQAMKAGDVLKHEGLEIEAVPAYNIDKFRSPGHPFHPQNSGIGFVIADEESGIRIYHAGDTDNIPEMKELKNIDVALLPVGGTYTMTAEEAALAALTIKPKFLVPMHYNSDKYGLQLNNDLAPLARGLAGKGIVLKILEPLV